jgi:hypothetical protein
MTEQKRSNLPWILAGCGALLVFGCCVSTAAGALFFRASADNREQALIGLAEAEARQGADENARRQAEEAAQRLAEQGPQLPPTGTPSVTVMATVTRVSGSRLTVRSGESCMFQVTYPARSNDPTQRWCNAPVRCGGVLLYGGGTGGFFPCRFSQSPASVVGSDTETTTGDRDGAFTIDTAAGILRVRDDSAGDYGTFELDATITRTM